MGADNIQNGRTFRQNRVRRLATDGMLCAAAIVGRIVLNVLPNIQPVTALLILMAAYIGTWDAAVSSIVIVLVTNLYLGMGIWTVYQIITWCFIALVSAFLFRKKHNRFAVLGWSILSGFIYGAFISVMSCRTVYSGPSPSTYLAYWLTGLPFDIYHAVGNALFVWFLQPVFERVIKNKI